MKQNKFGNIRKLGIALLSALLSAALLTGCSGTTPKDSNEITSYTNETESSTMQQTPTPTPSEASKLGYVIVTDTIPNDGSVDVTEALQELIDENPNRTIYFPDGIYTISQPIKTPAKTTKSVSLMLSNYAIIRASRTSWNSDEAMIRLGGKDADGDTTQNGSNYFLEGGIIDGSGIAKGVSVDSGRETAIRNVSIKHTTVGIHIKKGVNNGSSDCDVYNVNIIGNSASDSVGILVEGYDNTFTNIRIGCVNVGVHIRTQANVLRNVHPLFQISYDNYENSVGFWDEDGNNWYDFCYSDHFRIGFRLKDGVRSYFNNCFAFWYQTSSGKDFTVEAFHADGKFNSIVRGFRAGFLSDRPCQMLYEGKEGGTGVFEYVFIDSTVTQIENDPYQKYLKD